MKNTKYHIDVLKEQPDSTSEHDLRGCRTTFSKNLKKYRTYRKLTQKYMAQQLNVSTSAYGKWEIGSREPNTELIICIAEILKIPVGHLFEHKAYGQQNSCLTISESYFKKQGGKR